MNVQEFIEKFAEAIEIEDASVLTPEIEFRTLDEWDSLSYLSVIAMIDDEFDVQIETPEFKQQKTIQDLYNTASK